MSLLDEIIGGAVHLTTGGAGGGVLPEPEPPRGFWAGVATVGAALVYAAFFGVVAWAAAGGGR